MARPPTHGPTEAELAVLNVLWSHGPSTVDHVKRNLPKEAMAPSSVLKIMQIMVDKGLLKRDESKRPQIYRPAAKKEQVQRQILRRLVERAFDGSPANLVRQLTAAQKLSADERRQVREILSGAE